MNHSEPRLHGDDLVDDLEVPADEADLELPADDDIVGGAAATGDDGDVTCRQLPWNHSEPRLHGDDLVDDLVVPADEADLELPADDDVVGGAAATGDDGDVTSRSVGWNHSEPRLTADELPVD